MLFKNLHPTKPIKVTIMMKQASTFIFLFLIAASLFSAPNALAQDAKIGFVEPQIILERMPEVRAVQQRIQNFVGRKQEELSQKEANLQRQLREYQQRAGVMSETARAAEEERLGNLDLELRQAQQQAQMEIEQRRVELLSPILEQIQTSINTVAQREGFDYILNRRTSTGDMIVLYVSERVRTTNNITDAVMRHLGI